MKKQFLLTVGISLFLMCTAMPTFAQVSNDNEDGVNKVDERVRKNDFVPGQVLVKFKDESTIQVQRNAKGQFRAASINQVDKLLKDYGVNDMEKLFPAEQPKPKAKLRRKVAPNGSIVQEKNLDKVFWIKTNVQRPDSTLELIEQLKALPEVEYAEPNYRVYITADMPTTPTEVNTNSQKNIRMAPVKTETDASVICANPNQNPLYNQQYGITLHNIHQLWNKPIINKKRPVIAILDTGVDITHPDLKDNIWQNTREAEGELAYDDDGNGIVDDKYGWNFVDNYYDISDRNGHGTHVAGIAAACDNGVGVVGANPLALIMPVKVLSDRGGDVATYCRGMIYAAEMGADIINMSLGHNLEISQTEIDAIEKAYLTSIIVASAGNSGVSVYNMLDGPSWPAAYYLVLGVQACGKDGSLVGWSNFDPDGPIFSEDGIDGRNHEMMLAGVDIYSTLPEGQYDELSGTSMSSPLLAGSISALQMVKDYPSRDVLYADLIHLKADFEKIYSDETPRFPDIGVVSFTVDDNVEGNSNVDGKVDIGETIRFMTTLRNTWADATDIRLKLSVDPVYASFVEIINPEVSFGYSLSAYATSESQTPILVRFADNIGDNTVIRFTMDITCAESNQTFKQDFFIPINNRVKLSGLISEDRTLTADHVYHVTGTLGIMKGVTLTIEPGTRLVFDKDKSLTSFGKLQANGTPERPIIFESNDMFEEWKGVISHKSEDYVQSNSASLYTNADSTLFTLLPTPQTPNEIDGRMSVHFWWDEDVAKTFDLQDYMTFTTMSSGVFGRPFEDMTASQNLLTDPNYLTPAITQALADWKAYCQPFVSENRQSGKSNNVVLDMRLQWVVYGNPRDTISYCIMENAKYDQVIYNNSCSPYMKDCSLSFYNGGFGMVEGVRNNLTSKHGTGWSNDLKYCNIVNNNNIFILPSYTQFAYCNYFNNFKSKEYTSDIEEEYRNNVYWIGAYAKNDQPTVEKSDMPSYLGTSREDIVRPYVLELGNGSTQFATLDLSNMPTRPYSEAHGIVWKVYVNGKDAQDEFEDLAPLGVGKHKLEVYFNRPMNKAVAPQISFGVRWPYDQHAIDEDGSWNEEGTIYTTYLTITGKTTSDGLNRIYVQGAEDNEYFKCPEERERFNFYIQVAGSLATGFTAEAGLGRVNLTWNNTNNDFEDAMGFNIYRYTTSPASSEGGESINDTIQINKNIVDIETTEYTDYDVTPGETYYYLYKVLSTDLKEFDVSNVVAATPLTSTLGDANGSGEVDVADVITTVNKIVGMEPKPFIFEAADVNVDLTIDVLDIIGIIQKIVNPEAGVRIMAEAEAVYTIEDGTLYVESPVALAGVQVQIALSEECRVKSEEFATAEDLDGFEHTSAWLSENDYLFLAYNLNGKTLSAGKHALLYLGDAKISDIRLSDADGHNVKAVGDETTRVNRIVEAMTVKGIYDLQGRKLSGDSKLENALPKGVYIINGKKVVK